MPKIDMCAGDGCNVKDECYRFKSPISDPWLALNFFPGTQGKPCIYFIEVTTEKVED